MELTAKRKAALLAYCRIDELDAGEDALLESLYGAAVSYMEQAGVSEPKDGTPRRAQYDLAVNYLVLNAYDQRDTVITGTIVADNPAFRRILNQLKLTEPVVSDSDTTGSVSFSWFRWRRNAGFSDTMVPETAVSRWS